MLDFGFYNMDCMKGMKEFPDKFFDLAIVDPPYGDGNILNENRGGVLEQIRSAVRQVQEVTNWATQAHGVTRTGGTWARKFAKKLLRGTLRRERTTLQNFFASHEIRSYGAAITLNYHRPDAF